MTFLERVQAGWKIRRENRWWVPDFCGPITFRWQKPNGRKDVELTEKEQREMAKLGRSVAKQLRDYLAGALCAACGELLGHDEEIIQNEDDETMHARCESNSQGAKP